MARSGTRSSCARIASRRRQASASLLRLVWAAGREVQADAAINGAAAISPMPSDCRGASAVNGGRVLRSMPMSSSVVSGSFNWDRARIVVQPLSTGPRRTIVDGGSNARYVPSGHIVYAVGGTVFAVPFDVKLERLKEPLEYVPDLPSWVLPESLWLEV